jgi:hypothetical protein
MGRMFWLLLVPLMVLAGVAIGLRRHADSTEQISKRCSNCETPMSLRRVSWFKSFLLLAAWECPHCGNRSRSRTGTAS